jgi:hypothetical protein
MADTKKSGHYNVFTGKRTPGEVESAQQIPFSYLRDKDVNAPQRKQDAEKLKQDVEEAQKLSNESRQRLESGNYLGSEKKKGGVIKMAKGGSASKRADGCAVKGKTKGRMA